MIHVTAHAVQRALQRVPGIKTEAEALALLSSPTVNKAAEFSPHGSIYVKLGTGQHIAVEDSTVVTVLPAGVDARMSSEAHRYRAFCRAYEIAHWRRDQAA